MLIYIKKNKPKSKIWSFDPSLAVYVICYVCSKQLILDS